MFISIFCLVALLVLPYKKPSVLAKAVWVVLLKGSFSFWPGSLDMPLAVASAISLLVNFFNPNWTALLPANLVAADAPPVQGTNNILAITVGSVITSPAILLMPLTHSPKPPISALSNLLLKYW